MQAIPSDLLKVTSSRTEKGSFGNILERYYYGINPGGEPEPDFPKAGVELKSSAIRKLSNGSFSAKERLVLSLINYELEARKNFSGSSFLHKSAKIMLVSYLYQDQRPVVDHPVKIAKLLEFSQLPLAEQRIIEGDWQKIVAKIRAGKAHELSEGDTLYLGACTKAATSANRRRQAGGGPAAKPRAFSLKSAFMTALVRRELGITERDVEPIIKDVSALARKSFDEIIIERFRPYIGRSVAQIHAAVGRGLNKGAKNYYADLARRIMGVSGKKIEEFEKADIVMKTIQLKANGMPKECMSFPVFKYRNIVREVWDGADGETESDLRSYLQKRFFFVVYQCSGTCKKSEARTLNGVMFWTMPMADLDGPVKRVWKETVKRIKAGRADDLPKASESPVAHVRPHARNAQDTDITPQGRRVVKKCFWLDKKYIKKIVDELR